jgi:hypothetical protein
MTGLWASRSPNPSVRYFRLLGNLKGKLYRNTLSTAEALQTEIRNGAASILADEYQHDLQGSFQFHQCSEKSPII